MKNLGRGILAFSLVGLTQTGFGQCQLGTSKVDIESENLKAGLMNQGDYFWDPAASIAKFQWPKTSSPSKNLVFAAASWFGGKDLATNDLIVAAQTY